MDEWDLEDFDDVTPRSLNEFREARKKFIASTWNENHPGFPEYPDKIEGKDWFNF